MGGFCMGKKKKKTGLMKKLAVAGVCGVFAGTLLFAVPAGYRMLTEKNVTGQTEQPERKKEEGKGTGVLLTANGSTESKTSSVYDVSAIWNNALPSVVVVDVKSVSTYRFLGRVYEQESAGSGTGIIIAQGDELYVVTNHHVIDGATNITLTFVDGSTAPAEVKGSNESEDVAVLAVSYKDISEDTLKNIKLAAIGSSDTLRCGEMVIAIGNAAGQGLSLTVGYVSALDCEVEFENAKMKLIQTDAAINPGNSGGPLLNARGELVGINNAKLVETSVEGIGYAIPISTAANVINQMLHTEEIDYEDSAYLGIQCQDVTEALSEALSMPVGIYIAKMPENSPAALAGIPLYAVINEVNGITVKNEEQLRAVLSGIRGGSEGTVTVWERVKGEYTKKEYTVVFGTRKESGSK